MAADALFAFMIFEGNDFTLRRQSKAGNSFDRERGRLLNRYAAFLTAYPKVMYGMSRRAEAMVGLPGGSPVEVHVIGRRAVGFYQPYILATLESAPKSEISGDPEVLARMGCVFFIPDKYRVYREFIRDNRTLAEAGAGTCGAQGLRRAARHQGGRSHACPASDS